VNRAAVIAVIAVTVTLGSACSSASSAPASRAPSFPLPEDPLAAGNPWPATRQLGPDGLGLPEGALEAGLPAGDDGASARALMRNLREEIRELDGAGVTAILHAPFDGDLDPASLAGEVFVLDRTGAKADVTATVDGASIAIRGVRPWDSGADYVAVVRHVRGAHGEACRPSDGVKALLDDRHGDAFDAERPRVAGALAGAGIAKSDVCLAFSFHVEDVRAKVLALRDRVASHVVPPAPAITSVVDPHTIKGLESSEYVDGVVWGTFASPSFRDAATGRFVDARIDGRETPPADRLRFALSIPKNAAPPYRVVMGIHGLGGSIESTLPGYAEYLGQGGLAYITIDGVAHGSRAEPGTNASTSMFDVDDPRRARDALRQTLGDLYQLRQLVSGGLSIDGNGDTLARTGIGWSGGSYGGIMGTMIAATDPGIEAAHVEACGAPWHDVILLGDSGRGFAQVIFSSHVGFGPSEPSFEPLFTRFLELMQWLVDAADASSLAEFATRHPLDGTPKRILMQYWVGESLMPRAASERLISALDLPPNASVTNADGVRGVWPYDVVAWGAPTGLDGHQAFWKIPAARRQALDFLLSHGTAIHAPAPVQ
jgi:hypothetical protein